MFYLLAPDPTGAINGNVRRTGFVDSVTTVGAGARIPAPDQRVADACTSTERQDFEEQWLNEGLAHEAEELLFYREANLSPRSNIPLGTLQSTQPDSDRVQRRHGVERGTLSGAIWPSRRRARPFRDDDSLETRGATWSLLRYLADRKAGSAGASDAPTWQALVNTTRSGHRRISSTVFGSDLAARVRDWNIASLHGRSRDGRAG